MSSRSALAQISALIKAKRRQDKLGLRAAADASGLSPSTLSRLERAVASSFPDANTLTKLAAWLDLSLEALLSGSPAPVPKTAIASKANKKPPQSKQKAMDHLTTPEVIEVHLRADQSLSPETARALSRMFKTMYDHCTQTMSETSAKRKS